MTGRTAVVTGGAGGLGAAIAEELARGGDRVVIVDRDHDQAKQVAGRLRAAGACATAVAADVADPAAVAAAFDAVAALTGGTDVLVTAAGVLATGHPLEQPLDDWHEALAVNLTGAFLCCRAAAGQMVDRGSGAIVNVASVCGFVAMPRRAGYVASKHGLVGLTKALAVDLAPSIRVNAVCPGIVRTPMTEDVLGDAEYVRNLPVTVPQGVPATPRQVAQVVAFLAGETAGYVTGAAIPVDGGFGASATFDVGARAASGGVAAAKDEARPDRWPKVLTA